MTVTQEPVGRLLRLWRERRRRSQLDVAVAADVSARHLSFLETGRARPSRSMIERLCDELDVPLRERNHIYLAAGFAPRHAERPLEDLGPVREAVDAVLTGHLPHPALAVNVRWELLAANRAMQTFLDGVAPPLRGAPFNILRATLHPDGLGRRLRNFEQWRGLVVRRIRRQLERTDADGLRDLLVEVESYPAPPDQGAAPDPAAGNGLVMPMVLASDHGDLSLLYATTVFGSPRDVTLDEIAIETFFPADRRTAEVLRSMADAAARGA